MKEISFEDFYKLCQTGCSTIIDVREVAVFHQVHIESAQNLPLNSLADTYEVLDKNQTYYIICKSGLRSARACQFLSEQGYQTINVQGGMTAFENL